MANLTININQLNSDLQSIKNKIIEKGVEVPDGTKTSEYSDKIEEVYNKGINDLLDKLDNDNNISLTATTYRQYAMDNGWI